jgi:thiamine transport system ATP-binding protein
MSEATSGLQVRALSISYDGRALLQDFNLDVAPEEIVALLGPSGSGKSSLLRCIAGVQRPDSGTIMWAGEDIAPVPAHRRRIGLVFQDPLLFPHRDVAGNVGFGLPPEGRAQRVAELLELVGLPGFEHRDVATLSGGEAQRIALARALAPRPRLLLLDEPFGALDRDLRDRLAVDVKGLLHDQGTPAIHVTHDREEADLIADRIVRLAPPLPGPYAADT